jgi:hypothetical protein
MTIDRTKGKAETFTDRPCAVLWDESLLWGLMARQALADAGLPFDLLTSEDIRRGGLSRYRMIFVPGGWASNKLAALGDRGRDAIRRFVESGGSYLGICGGAGMATEEGLGLLPIARKSTAERVPSFSGGMRLSCDDHEIWRNIENPDFSAWWPSQFHIVDGNIRILARYEAARMDAFSADISVADGGIMGWSELERRYGILLDPARLHGEPAVMEGRFGRGKVILSLIHFDTPGDLNGVAVLRNIRDYLMSGSSSCVQMNGDVSAGRRLPELTPELIGLIAEIKAAVAGLADAGIRNFLWYGRNPFLLQWRRGVRGLEYTTLIAMIREILTCLNDSRPVYAEGATEVDRSITPAQLKEALGDIREQLIPFVEKAKQLLVRERFYMQAASLSPLNSADGKINGLRDELFGSAMRHGGDFKGLIDAVDRLLFSLIKEA